MRSVSDRKRPGQVWLYRLPDGTLVGFGALAQTNWKWQGEDDPRLPVSIVIWYAVHGDFQKKPEGPRENHYSFQIFESLVAEAELRQDTHPILGLFVSQENQRAMQLYEDFGFTKDGFELGPDAAEDYQKMYVVLNPPVFVRMYEAAMAKRKK